MHSLRASLPSILLLLPLTLLLAPGCGGDDPATSTSGTTGGGGPGGGGSGGGGGQGAQGGTGGIGGTGGGNGGDGGTGGDGGSGGGAAGDHVLISEVAVAPGAAEFVELYNPTAAAVDLSSYYLSDNSAYHGIAAGQPWAPVVSLEGTDFLARFPDGTSIAAGGVLVVALHTGFFDTFGVCPDLILHAAPLACGGGMIPAMVSPPNGGIGDAEGSLLSNEREMLMLFRWNGQATSLVEDVDYVTWGAGFETPTRVDKTGVATYLPDTPRMNQKPATAPLNFESIERCGPNLEAGEKLTGGNGVTGHDETSEALDTSFVVQAQPSPGAKNACL